MYKTTSLCSKCGKLYTSGGTIDFCESCKPLTPEACPHDDFYVMNTGTATCRKCKYWWQDAETVKVAADRGFVRLTNDYIEDILNLVKSDSKYTEYETNDLISVFRSGLERTIPPLWGEYVKRYEKYKDPKYKRYLELDKMFSNPNPKLYKEFMSLAEEFEIKAPKHDCFNGSYDPDVDDCDFCWDNLNDEEL